MNQRTKIFFALPVGKKLTYETTAQGSVTERIEIEILQETMTIEGVETVIYLDKEYKNEQRVGDSYKQEFYVGHAEDIRDTVATGETVSTKTRTDTDCVKVYDWTPLEKNAREHKYHCPEVGALVLTEDLQTGERSELVNVVQPQPSNSIRIPSAPPRSFSS